MAILSKIRNRSALLIVVIAIALLAFLLPELVKSGGSASNNIVGSINGVDVVTQDFMRKVENMTRGQQNSSMTQAVNSVWEQEVRKAVFEEKFEQIGLTAGEEQVIGVLKNDPQSSAMFLNAAGKFDEKKYKEFETNKLKSKVAGEKEAWLDYKKQVLDFSKMQSYNTLLKAGVYTTQLEGKIKFERENNKVDFDYISLAFTTVSDKEVKITDDEIKAYMSKNPKKYKSENSRSVEYVFIENVPSKEDESAIKAKIDGLQKGGVIYNDVTKKTDSVLGFGSAKDIASFVNKYSDIKFDSTYVAKKDLPAEHSEALFNLGSGVYGPYLDGGYYKLSRVAGRKGNSSAKVSHILISYKGSKSPTPGAKLTKAEAKAKAESLLAQAKANPAMFPVLAMTNSDDPGSKQNGGVYDNVNPGQMVPPFNDFVFNKPVGAMGVVETDFGFHVMKNEAKYDAVLLGTVAVKVRPSDKTQSANSEKAFKIESDANSVGLEKAAKNSKLTVVPAVSIKGSDENVGNLGQQRGIVSWAFNEETDVNAIKKFDTPNGYVIAKLKEINESGLQSLETAKPTIENILKNEKKAEILRKKIKGVSLEEIAKATGSKIASATQLSFASPMIQNVGYEPKIVGAAYGLKPNAVSKPIDGNFGVFVLKGKSITKAPAPKDYKTQLDQINQQSKSSSEYTIYQYLKDKASIEDNRHKF